MDISNFRISFFKLRKNILKNIYVYACGHLSILDLNFEFLAQSIVFVWQDIVLHSYHGTHSINDFIVTIYKTSAFRWHDDGWLDVNLLLLKWVSLEIHQMYIISHLSYQ